MQGPFSPNKERRISQINLDEKSKDMGEKSNREEDRNSTSEISKETNQMLNKHHFNYEKFEQIFREVLNAISSQNSSKRKSQLQTKIMKRSYFKETSKNMLGCIVSFLTISDCFAFIKLDKRSRSIILTNHILLSLYIQLKRIRSLTFTTIFEHDNNCNNDSISKLDEFKVGIIGDRLSSKQTEILFRDYFNSITKIYCFFFPKTETDDNLMKYLKLLFSNPECKITKFICFKKFQNDWPYVCDILNVNSSIQTLQINNFEFTYDILDQLIPTLYKNKYLKDISISHKRNFFREIYKEEYNYCFSICLKIFNNMSSLQNLTLELIDVDKKLSFSFSDFIKDSKTIKSLKIKIGNFINTSDIFHNAFRHNNTLESLSLDHCRFNKINFKKLVKDLTFKKEISGKLNSLQVVSNLKHISFSSCHLDEKQIKMITGIVKDNPKIESLRLAGNTLSGLSFPWIISMIKDLKSLKKLDFFGGELNDKEFKSICEALLLNNTLESLKLSYNNFSCSKNQIHELFAVNKTLKKFYMYGNSVDQDVLDLINKYLGERN